jgi:hypothetical protein
MLDDPRLVCQQIGSTFGLTRQRIAQLAKELGINARQGQRERTLRREPSVIKKQYPSGIRAVIDKIRRSGMRVTPYNSRLSCRPNVVRRSQAMVFVNGVLCSIQLRKGHKFAPYGRDYARFDVNERTRKVRITLGAMRRGHAMNVYIIPITHLRKVSFAYIPVKGKYAASSSKKPKKDWNRYEGAWHMLGSRRSPSKKRSTNKER